MIVAWIVITLVVAILVGASAAAWSDDGFGFFFGFLFVCQLSLLIAAVYVIGHFVSKYW